MAKSLNTIIIACICSLITVFLYHSYINGITVVNEENYAQLVTQIEDNRSPSVLSREQTLNELSFIEPAARAKNSVVALESVQIKDSRFEKDKYIKSNGSGVIISPDGYVVTNYHVVENSDELKVTLEDKREFKAEMIGYDRSTDIALLKLDVWGLPFLEFGDSDNLEIGEWVLAIGNPFKLSSSVTAGIVSAKARNIDALSKNDIESFIQSDAVINPGSSGGALVNTDGLLVGICTAIISSTGNYEGLSFAIPSNLAHKVIIDLKQFGSVQRGNLGITVTDVDAQIAEQYDMEIIKGVQIASVNLNSAAAESNLIKTDIILSIDNVTIDNSSEFYEQINRYRPGDQLQVEVYRRGRIMNFPITLRNHLNTTDYISVRSDKELRDIGIEIRDLNSIEKKRIQTSGIMVISISRGSKIDDTNMEPGFIVERVNGADIESAQQFMNILKSESGEITLVGFYERYPGRFPYTFMK